MKKLLKFIPSAYLLVIVAISTVLSLMSMFYLVAVLGVVAIPFTWPFLDGATMKNVGLFFVANSILLMSAAVSAWFGYIVLKKLWNDAYDWYKSSVFFIGHYITVNLIPFLSLDIINGGEVPKLVTQINLIEFTLLFVPFWFFYWLASRTKTKFADTTLDQQV